MPVSDCLKELCTAPLPASRRASPSRRAPLIAVNAPPTNTALPETAIARTVLSAAGAQASNAPVRALTAASRLRATVRPPAVTLVKSPPTKSVFPEYAVASTMPLKVGSGSGVAETTAPRPARPTEAPLRWRRQQ